MKIVRTLVQATLFAGLTIGAVAGCAGIPAQNVPDPSVAVPHEPVPNSFAGASATGSIPKTVGQEGGVTEDGEIVLKFVATKIQMDPTCDVNKAYKDQTKPSTPGGHFIAITYDVTTLAGYTDGDDPFRNFQWVGPDGYTKSAGATNFGSSLCAGDNSLLTKHLEAGRKYNGVVILDVPDASGSFTMGTLVGSTSWEYKI